MTAEEFLCRFDDRNATGLVPVDLAFLHYSEFSSAKTHEPPTQGDCRLNRGIGFQPVDWATVANSVVEFSKA